MAADVAGVDWYQEDSASPITVSKPAAFAAGDLLVGVIIQHNNPSAQTDLTAPADWTLSGTFDGTTSDGKIWTHAYNAADPSTWNFPYRATADVCMGVFRVTGADVGTVTLVIATSTTETMATPADSPSVTPTGADDVLICILANHSNGTAFTETDPAGMTDLGQVQVTGGFFSMAAAKQQLASGAATGVRTWTSINPTGLTGGTISIAIKSAAAFAPSTVASSSTPPPWLMYQIAAQQMASRVGDVVLASAAVPETGNVQLAITSNGLAKKVAPEVGKGQLAVTSNGAAKKIGVEAGVGQLAVTATSLAKKVVGQTGTATVAVTATGLGKKVAKGVSSASVAITTVGAEKKITAETGGATVALVASGTYSKKTPQAGSGVLAITSRAQTGSARGQTGAVSIGIATTGAAKKTVGRTGSSNVALNSVAGAKKIGVEAGVASIAITTKGASGKVAKASAVGLLTLSTTAAQGKRTAVRGATGVTIRTLGISITNIAEVVTDVVVRTGLSVTTVTTAQEVLTVRTGIE